MYKEIFPDIFQVEIPLRNNPLRALNCFILRGKRSLVIDTGFDTQENRLILSRALEDLGINPASCDLFLTHLHSDHTGLAHYLSEEGLTVYMGEDRNYLENSLREDSPHWLAIKKYSLSQGLAQDKLDIKEHPGFKYRPKEIPEIIPTEEGDTFQVGDYSLEVLDLPGHTPGLQALYERSRGLLFSGDHILAGITPNITFWGEEVGDSLGIYMDNLKRVKTMDIRGVLSSHRYLPQDPLKRIDELLAHHEKRLEETRSILRGKAPQTVRNITRSMHWDIRARDWDDFPSSQKWFAAGEAQAHLVHLREKGEVKEESLEGVLYYSLIKK